LWGSPGFLAGVRTGDEIVAVGERAYKADVLKDAVIAAKGTTLPIRLVVKRGDAVRTIEVRHNGGLRYPRLVKVGKGEGPLDKLLKAR
jgi:C-terminal processing protease CtpA/Prc